MREVGSTGNTRPKGERYNELTVAKSGPAETRTAPPSST